MFGRIFGRGKDDQDQAVCAECGRTLLAGEWTQTVVDEHGEERLICSLCGQAYTGGSEPVAAAPTPANNGRVRETRSEARYDERPAHAGGPGARHARRERRLLAGAQGEGRPDRAASRPSWRARRPSGRSWPASSRASAPPERPERSRRARLTHRRLVRAGRAHLGRDAGRVRRRDGGAARGGGSVRPAAGGVGRAGASDLAGRGGRSSRRPSSRASPPTSRPTAAVEAVAVEEAVATRSARRAHRPRSRRRCSRTRSPSRPSPRTLAAERRRPSTGEIAAAEAAAACRRRRRPCRESRRRRSPPPRRPPRPRPWPRRSRSCSAASTCST